MAQGHGLGSRNSRVRQSCGTVGVWPAQPAMVAVVEVSVRKAREMKRREAMARDRMLIKELRDQLDQTRAELHAWWEWWSWIRQQEEDVGITSGGLVLVRTV